MQHEGMAAFEKLVPFSQLLQLSSDTINS